MTPEPNNEEKTRGEADYFLEGEYVEITDPEGGLPLDSDEARQRIQRTRERLQEASSKQTPATKPESD